MDFLALYEDVEQLVNVQEDFGKVSRKRLRLCDKKEIVDCFQTFVIENSSVLSTTETSMKAFVKQYNNELHSTRISLSNLSKWVKAEKRGEYLEWNRINRLESYISNKNKILLGLDFALKQRDMYHAVYNRVAKSPSLPVEYGVVARKFTPAGTFLGFYKGEVVDGLEACKRSPEYMFIIGKNKFVDARDYMSCYARYYNCAMKASDQNVSVERIEWTNPQKAICFIANRDVAQGEEFLISYGSSYWEAAVCKASSTSAFRRVCTFMINNAPDNYQTADALYSVEAPSLAAAFEDDMSDSEEAKETEVDSDYANSDSTSSDIDDDEG
jgi:hypothetical protein